MNNNYKMTSIDKQALCTQIRRDILRMVHAVQSGHPGGSLGCVEYFVSLYFDVLKSAAVKLNDVTFAARRIKSVSSFISFSDSFINCLNLFMTPRCVFFLFIKKKKLKLLL